MQDVFAKALGEEPAGQDSQMPEVDREGTKSMSTTQENEPSADDRYDRDRTQRTPPRARSKGPVGGGLSAKPRRLSRSPVKQPERAPVEYPAPEAMPDDFNPFKKTGLRRSPTISSQAEAPAPSTVPDVVDGTVNPFKKTGLRRSPISSQPVEPLELGIGRSPSRPVSKALRSSPILSQPLEFIGRSPSRPVSKALRRSPVAAQAFETAFRRSPVPEQPTMPDEPVYRRSPPPRQLPQALDEILAASEPNAFPRMLFAEIPKETPSSNIDALPPNQLPEISSTPQEPVASPDDTITGPRLAEPAEVPSPAPKALQPSPFRPPEMTRAEEAVQDLFYGTRRVEEPELPPTPSQRGIADPVVTTPPTGIHDTPSKRARRNKALSAKLKSSPLKPKDPAPEEPAKESSKSKDSAPQIPAQEVRPVSQWEPKVEKPKRRKSARFLIPEDPHTAKKKARDDLLQELQQLRADVTLANQENERLRLGAESKKKVLSAALKSDELHAMLLRSTAPETASVSAPKLTSIFKSISAFLPFRPRRNPTSTPISEKSLPSHLPIALNDPLPYLQAFSPLTYTSTITLLSSDPGLSESTSQAEEAPILQRHAITASHPSGLFSTKLSMTVDASSLSIAALDILRLDMNAEKELGTFVRARARSESALRKDITVICWAMSRWIEVSIQRARLWCAVEQELGSPEARVKAWQKRRKRRRQSVVNDDDATSSMDRENEVNEKQIWTRKQLFPHIGRTSMELSNDEVELRFEWRISFDWTGEVESAISGSARLPRTCKSSFLDCTYHC